MIINSGCVYFALDGRAIDLSEDIRWSDTHWGKYNNGMANYLHHCDDDESTGDVEWHGYVQRFGKRLLHSDDQGFVTVERYETQAECEARFQEIQAEYHEWLDELEAEVWW